jgi:hypothetical protein
VREAVKVTCSCAHRLLYALKEEGDRLGFLLIFDDEPGSTTYGQRVEECPGCGERTGLVALFSASDLARR